MRASATRSRKRNALSPAVLVTQKSARNDRVHQMCGRTHFRMPKLTINTVVMSNGTIIPTMASYITAMGDGTGFSTGRRTSILPSFAGLIRKGEISSGRIPHVLAALAPQSLLEAAAVWPAAAFDRSSHYTGTLPMGSLLAIPPTIDLTKLGLSPQGLVIARAAQVYGVYLVDSGGSGLTFLAEFGDPEIAGMVPQPHRPGGTTSRSSHTIYSGSSTIRQALRAGVERPELHSHPNFTTSRVTERNHKTVGPNHRCRSHTWLHDFPAGMAATKQRWPLAVLSRNLGAQR